MQVVWLSVRMVTRSRICKPEPWRLVSAILHIKGFSKAAGDRKKKRKYQRSFLHGVI